MVTDISLSSSNTAVLKTGTDPFFRVAELDLGTGNYIDLFDLDQIDASCVLHAYSMSA